MRLLHNSSFREQNLVGLPYRGYTLLRLLRLRFGGLQISYQSRDFCRPQIIAGVDS